MIAPMLASPLAKVNIIDWNDWAIEEKFDGHRLIVERSGCSIVAHTRPRKHAGSTGKTMATKTLPSHLVTELMYLPNGVYDGELIGGDTSTDVTRTDLAHTLRFVVFDVLMTPAGSCMMLPYDSRRALLVGMMQARQSRFLTNVLLAESVNVTCQDDVTAFNEHVWERGGEGSILKRRAARYLPGKRSPDFVKIKKLQTVVCTVVGFEATKGRVMKRGAFATVILEDAQGHRTSVKTKDDVELEAFNRQARTGNGRPMSLTHPAIGRKLRIEFQDYAADGGYRHPRWDRWEDE